jgi:hypothetical protein
MLKKKYSCFENTNLYRTYSDLLDDAELIDVEHSDFFEQLICDLRCDVGCNVNQPTEDQINNYIQNNEDIDDDLIDTFVAFIRNIFENAQNIVRVIKTNKKKESIRLKREEIKQKQKGITEEDKKDKLLQKQIWSSTICVCELCKLKYTQSNRAKHMLSSEHQTRVDAINLILTEIDSITKVDELRNKYRTA